MLREIQTQLNRIEGILCTMADTIDQENVALTNVEDAVQKLGTDLQAEITALQAAITAGADTTQQVNRLNAIAASLTNLDAKAVAATPVAASAIAISPSIVTLTGGAGANVIIQATEAANPSASFNAASSNTSVVTVAPGTTAGSFIVTEVAAGTATITINDNATPVANLATVNVTAS